jgi:hypothetical protein
MKTVNSISGGKTSAYIAKHYTADINIFSLVRIENRECLWMEGKDEKTRQYISDRIGCEFIGTAEMDAIIYTILDLEQFIGQEIKIVTGETFEQIIIDRGGYLPNRMVRYCTIEMKLKPIFEWLKKNTELPVKMRIGYRPNETRRMNNMLARADKNSIEKFDGVKYRVAEFPLSKDNISKDTIYSYWDDKPIRFAYRNNCVMCVNRQPMMIAHMATKERRKVEWALKQEQLTGKIFIKEASMSKILNYSIQGSLFNEDDFSDCDSGYCGI